MPQKSITSFFNSKPKKEKKSEVEIPKKQIIEEQPLKEKVLKNRVINDSDEDDDTVPSQTVEASHDAKTTSDNVENKQPEKPMDITDINSESDCSLQNFPCDVTTTPNGSVKRKTARKIAPPAKRHKIQLSDSANSDSQKQKVRESSDSEVNQSDEINEITNEKDSSESEMKQSDKTHKVKEIAKENDEIYDNESSAANSSKSEIKKTPKKLESKKSSPKARKSPKTKSKTKESVDVKKEEKVTKMGLFFKPKPIKESKTSEEESADSSEIVSLLKYNPGKSNYHPVNNACWKKDDKVPYMALARTFALIEDTTKRLKIVEYLTNLFRSIIILTPTDLVSTVYLSLNKLAPAYKGVELGIGETLLMKAIAEATGRTTSKIKADAKKSGDLGIVAENSRTTQKMMFSPPPLFIRNVIMKLRQIAAITGNASQGQRINILKSLLIACKECEARYLIRSCGGKLRIGLAEQSVLTALANAVYLTPPGQDYPPKIVDRGKGRNAEDVKAAMDEYALILKTAYCELPNYDEIIKNIILHGMEELPNHCRLTPGIPLKPMLAHPTTGVSEVFNRFDKNAFTCEFKYDGERAQVHVLEDGNIHIYSRNQENNTTKYPDIIQRMPKVLKEGVKTCVIDTEAVAWDPENKHILPFQVLTTRKRKEVALEDIKVQVCIYAFDILYFNGESLVKKPFRERREILLKNFSEIEGEFMFAKSRDSTDTDQIAEFLDESIKGNCEGLMVKTLDIDATYEIAKRSHNWLKLKKDYLEGMGDTLDLAVIGGYLGKGKRTGVYGGFLLACYDDDAEEFQTICKIGTGFSDQDLSTHHDFFKPHVIDTPKPYYRLNGSEADVWFEPAQVWEVKAADLSISPVYAAAAGIVEDKGISLRFPRFIRIRDDKKPEDATNSTQVAELYNKQEQIKNQEGNKKKSDAPDYY